MTIPVEEVVNAAADAAANTILLSTGLPSVPDSFRAAMRAAAWQAITALATEGHIPLRKAGAA